MGRHKRGAAEPAVLAGRYRLVGRIASGGMAEVWRAEDTALQRQVAVKLLSSQDVTSEGAGQSLWREASEAARLVHPNVVGVYEVAADGGRQFIVMEFVPGRDLAAILRDQGPFPPAWVAEIGAQAARALAAAHAIGMVHRAVKPANLLVAPDGTVKLADFGIAAVSASRRTAESLVGMGSYISPEQAMGRPAGPAGDLYALGCVLYELLIGHPPFVSDDPVTLLRRHIEDEPAAPGLLRPDIPAELEQAVLRLLRKNPGDRPQDTAEVAEVLQQISGDTNGRQHGEAWPIPSTRVTPAPHGADEGRPPGAEGEEPEAGPSASRDRGVRRRLLAAGVAAVAVIAVGVSLLAAMGSGHPDRRPPLTMPNLGEPLESPSSAPSPTATPRPSPAKRPSKRPATRPPTQSPAELLSALEGRLDQQASAGQLDSKVARNVGRQTGLIRRRLSQGRTGDLTGHVTEIRQTLDQAAHNGRWTPDATVYSLLSQLASGL